MPVPLQERVGKKPEGTPPGRTTPQRSSRRPWCSSGRGIFCGHNTFKENNKIFLKLLSMIMRNFSLKAIPYLPPERVQEGFQVAVQYFDQHVQVNCSQFIKFIEKT